MLCLHNLFFTNAVYAVNLGARANVETLWPCSIGCGGPGSRSDSRISGGENFLMADAMIDNQDGRGRSFARLLGPLRLPNLGATASSDPDSLSSAAAIGIQSYNYVGDQAKNFTLEINLDGEVDTSFSDDAFARLRGDVAIILGRELPSFPTHFPTLVLETVPFSDGLDLLGRKSLFIPENSGQQILNDEVSFTLFPGDRLILWAKVTALGEESGQANAYNTLSLGFDDAGGLVLVPEPTTYSLAIAALCMGFRRRRKPAKDTSSCELSPRPNKA